MTDPIISVRSLRTQFGPQVIHDGLDLDVMRGEILGVVGGSGTGKSVLMREIIGLITPAAGSISIFGNDVTQLTEAEQRNMQSRWGVLFQDGALFSALSVAENIQVPLRTYTDLPERLLDDVARIKVHMVGLPANAATKLPSELSGGMRKRAGLARALALDPDIVFLDEPTAGLDPIGAHAFDELILQLRGALGLTVVMITHDLDSLARLCDRIAVLVDQKVVVDTMANLMNLDHPWIQDYFHGPRARAAFGQAPAATTG